MKGRHFVAVTLALVVLTAGAAGATPPADRVLPVDQYTTEKGRALAAAHVRALQDLNTGLYHCWPWVEVQKASIGFYRPKNAQQDDRYLSARIYIEQDASPAFGRLRFEERAAAMFSRYVGPLLRRMTRDSALAGDAKLDGFTTILEWMKPAPPINGRPVHETIAVFIDKAAALEYLSGQTDIKGLTSRAKILGFDGQTPLGTVTLCNTWDENFVTTFKVANYVLEPGVTC